MGHGMTGHGVGGVSLAAVSNQMGYKKGFGTVAAFLADTTTYAEGEILVVDGRSFDVVAPTATDYDYQNGAGTPQRIKARANEVGNAVSREVDLGNFGSDGAALNSAIAAAEVDGVTVRLPGSKTTTSIGATVINLPDKARLAGSTAITSTSGNALEALGGAGTAKHYDIVLSDVRQTGEPFTDATATGLRLKNQGYTFLLNSQFRANGENAMSAEAVVGLQTLNAHFLRSPTGQRYISPSSIAATTTTKHFGATTDIVDTCIMTEGALKQFLSMGSIYQNFSNFFDKDTTTYSAGEALGFTSIGDWFEGYGTNKVTFASDGFTVNSSDGILELNDIEYPLFLGSYITGPSQVSGGYAPRFEHASIVSGTGIATIPFANQRHPGQFSLNCRPANWGGTTAKTGATSYGLSTSMPIVGDLGTPEEMYYRPGVAHSMGVSNHAGIWDGAAESATNYCHTAIGTTAFAGSGKTYWPFENNASGETYTKTTGVADPYGGTTAVRIAGGTSGTVDISNFNNGGKWMTAVVVAKGTAVNWQVYVAGTPGTAAGFNKTFEFDLPDTDWRLLHFIQYLPASSGATFRTRLGVPAGSHSIDVARVCFFEGAKVLPPIGYGQSITQPFRFIHGNVEILGTAAPTAGDWLVGDRVRYKVPSGGNIGQICTVAGSPGTWTAH